MDKILSIVFFVSKAKFISTLSTWPLLTLVVLFQILSRSITCREPIRIGLIFSAGLSFQIPRKPLYPYRQMNNASPGTPYFTQPDTSVGTQEGGFGRVGARITAIQG